MVACPFRRPVVPYRMFTFIMCLILLMTGYCFYMYSPPLDVSVGYSLLNNRFDNTQWASFTSDLHTNLL